jgi:hypothetical protein
VSIAGRVGNIIITGRVMNKKRLDYAIKMAENVRRDELNRK